MTFLNFACHSRSGSLVELVRHSIAHLYAKIGALDISNNKHRCLEILDNLQASEATMLDKDFCPFGLFCS